MQRLPWPCSAVWRAWSCCCELVPFGWKGIANVAAASSRLLAAAGLVPRRRGATMSRDEILAKRLYLAGVALTVGAVVLSWFAAAHRTSAPNFGVSFGHLALSYEHDFWGRGPQVVDVVPCSVSPPYVLLTWVASGWVYL